MNVSGSAQSDRYVPLNVVIDFPVPYKMRNFLFMDLIRFQKFASLTVFSLQT
jgi:hypothetical protein